MNDLSWKVNGQPWLLRLIYIRFLFRLNVSSDYNDFDFNSFKKSTFQKSLFRKFDIDVK